MFTGIEEIKMEFLICCTSTFLLGINNLLQELKFEKEAHGNISQNEHHTKERNTSGREDFLTKEIDALKDSLNRSHKNAEQFALNFVSYTFPRMSAKFSAQEPSESFAAVFGTGDEDTDRPQRVVDKTGRRLFTSTTSRW